MKGRTEIIKLLLARDDVNVNTKDKEGRTGFQIVCTPLFDTSRSLIGEIGGLICIQRDIRPSELMKGVSGLPDSGIMEEIQASINRKQQKSARK